MGVWDQLDVRGWALKGAGRISCGKEIILFTFQRHFLNIFDAFSKSLYGSWRLLGSYCAQVTYHGSKLTYWGSPLVLQGQALGELGSSLITFGRSLMSI